MMIRPPSDLYAAISIAGRLLYGGDYIERLAAEIGCEPTEDAVRAWAAQDFTDGYLIAIDEWIVRRLAERLDEIHDAIAAFGGRVDDRRNEQLRRLELIEISNPTVPDFCDEPLPSIEETIAGHPCADALREIFAEE